MLVNTLLQFSGQVKYHMILNERFHLKRGYDRPKPVRVCLIYKEVVLTR